MIFSDAASLDSASWFSAARFGLFIHWGPYATVGRGEQVLFRENLDQLAYARMACAWNPCAFDARTIVALAKEAGAKYCVFTTRHHDGYCLWNSALTDYTSFRQAPGRDFVREYVDACHEAGLKVGLYYSLADWRIPAYWLGKEKDPQGWAVFQDYVHAQVKELLTGYGKIDVLWFDGPWPHSAEQWNSEELVLKIRRWQPDILINNRLDASLQVGGCEQAGASAELGDFGTPEHQITAEEGRAWESCQVTTWRLWGYARGEHYRSAEQLLDLLCESASKGGNLLLNVGPDGNGHVPPPAEEALRRIGRWLAINGEAIYGTERGDFSEFVTYGLQTRRGNNLYLIYRFWPGNATAHIAGIATPCRKAVLVSDGRTIDVRQTRDGLELSGLPATPPCDLFPVIRLEFDEAPQLHSWARERLWAGDASRMASWAAARGSSVWADGKIRPAKGGRKASPIESARACNGQRF
ncbi:MAG: alpha-L-fucosidase [Chthoniobacteraceae bacterium]